jgi:aryl-alcohol dehydrogenase-like predicted oxidoreductase
MESNPPSPPPTRGAIPTRPLGATGLVVSAIGLGGAAYGRPGYVNLGHGEDLPDHDPTAMEQRAHALLDAAHAAGVRYLDVARSYGRAEAFLARWLADRRPEGVVVGSKWGYTYTAGWAVDADEHEVKDHSLATFARQRAETAALLGDALDLFLVHSATLDSGVLDDDAVLEALGALAGEGVVVGLSLSGPGQAATLRRALDLAAAGRAPFACVQATWNPLEPSAGPALAEASAAGWGVVVKEAVANGRLTPRGDATGPLTALAAAHDVGVDAIAIAAALAQPFCDVALSGAATIPHLEANLRATDVDLDGDDLARLGALAEPAEAYWARRSAQRWT